MMASPPTTSVSWPGSAAPVATAAPAVVQVAPAAPAARDGQPDLDHRSGQTQALSRSTGPSTETAAQAADTALRRRAESELRAQELERMRLRQEAQAETVEQLRQALLRVWEASGAVVEHALAQAEAGEPVTAQEAQQALKAYESGEAWPAGSRVSQRV